MEVFEDFTPLQGSSSTMIKSLIYLFGVDIIRLASDLSYFKFPFQVDQLRNPQGITADTLLGGSENGTVTPEWLVYLNMEIYD